MSALGYKLFPSLAKERDRLAAELEITKKHHDMIAAQYVALTDHCDSLADQLAAMTLRAVSAEAVSRQVAKEAAEAYHRIAALNDELAAMTLRATSAEAKLAQMHRPGPLEPTTIKVGTAADVRRIVEQQNFRDEQENSDGIR